MKNIIVAALFLLLSTNALACYDGSLSNRANFDNCLTGAEQGIGVAQSNLGAMYYFGKGVAQDYKEAVRWHTKAAEQGVAEAQYSLGYSYDNGEGAAQDYKEAVRWYTKAAEQGNVDAQFYLGTMYHFGKGVAQDYKSALLWYNIAAANGNSDAAITRDLVAKRMTPSQIEKAQDMAREWMAEHQ